MSAKLFGWEVQMQDYAETNFVDNYEPGDDALVKLKHARFVQAKPVKARTLKNANLFNSFFLHSIA